MTIGLFIGRFQPLHLGHVDAVEQALKQVDSLIIGIGSSEKHGTSDNPFTFEERKHMLMLIFPKCKVIAIPDIDDDTKWAAHVCKIVGPFDIVFSGNPNTIKLFREAGHRTKIVKFRYNLNPQAGSRNGKRRGVFHKVSATTIRSLLAKGDARWKKMVPASVAKLIGKII